ncbi:DUF4352 domain-containing protein [Alteribacter natronophilus]|uniref:DUF4352 domain-containing protein n=1 Tax=Alteribacter natronophilus TaxID=2583810 RepID=UPI00110E1CC7|nr:DUF4352 domain-containing protein [Alteribacter natronophilus]TMW72272.1 DUF4352 domain-containing protein [Alteribacter natronophilus]
MSCFLIAGLIAPDAEFDHAHAEQVAAQADSLTEEEQAAREQYIAEAEEEARKEAEESLEEARAAREEAEARAEKAEQERIEAEQAAEEEEEARKEAEARAQEEEEARLEAEAKAEEERKKEEAEAERKEQERKEAEAAAEAEEEAKREAEEKKRKEEEKIAKAEEEAQREAEEKAQQEAEEQARAEAEAAENDPDYYVGSPVRVGDLEYLVHDFWFYSSLSDGFSQLNTSGTFLVMDVEVHNHDSRPRLVDSSMFTLYDGEGRTFHPDYDADYYVNQIPFELFINEVNPNLSVRTNIVFEIPETWGLELEVASSFGWSLWGHDYERIFIN